MTKFKNWFYNDVRSTSNLRSVWNLVRFDWVSHYNEHQNGLLLTGPCSSA
jgi:hypothetical protein